MVLDGFCIFFVVCLLFLLFFSFFELFENIILKIDPLKMQP